MKANELLLHIGHPKTGTTTLQFVLNEAREAMRAQGVLFPDIYPHWGNAEIMGYLFFNRQHVEWWRAAWLKSKYPDVKEEALRYWDQIKKEVAATRPDKLVISSESFFRPAQPTAIANANDLFSEVAESTKIAAYLRAPDTFYLSRMQQNLKMFMTTQHGSHTRLKDVIDPLTDYWNGSIALNIFDPRVMHDGDIVTDFMNRHLPQLDLGKLPRQIKKANTTLSAEAMAILFEITTGQQTLRVGRDQITQEILRYDAQLANPTKPQLKPHIARSVINWSAPDLFWLRDTHGLTFPSIDYAGIDPENVDYEFLQPTNIHELCDVNMDRKQELFSRALRSAKLPRKVRRWFAKR